MLLPHCKLLHWNYAVNPVPEVPAHVHSYYQIELCVNGLIDFSGSGRKLQLRAGEWMLIPPGVTHGMTYSGKNLQYYSFKFEVENLPGTPLDQLIFQPANFLSRWAIGAFRELQSADSHLYLPLNENRPILESMLYSMLFQALAELKTENHLPPLLRTIADLISESGALINVQSAAEQLNMNVSQLKYRYKLIQKNVYPAVKNITIKEFIDKELMKNIDRFLFYSELTLAQIASQTKFNNIYTFSRFVRRLTGQTPSQRRASKITAV